MAERHNLPSVNTPHPTPQPKVLRGWKDIASYLGKGVRTVQRYERELRLPVRRLAAGDRGSVTAFRHELDAWVLASPMRSSDKARFDSRCVARLKSRFFELNRLYAEGHELRAALDNQRTTLMVKLNAVAQTLSATELFASKNEKHTAIAIEQKAHASEMRAQARKMCDRAIEMRTPGRRQLIVNC
jgi:hypothetical protein